MSRVPTITSPVGRELPRTIVAVALVLVIAATTVSVRTQEMPLPPDIQLPLLLKVLSADRQLRARAGEELVIGFFYQSRFRASAKTAELLAESAAKSLQPPLSDQPVRFVPIAFEGTPDWGALITAHNLDVCYIAPLRALDVSGLIAATRAHGVVSCSGVPEYVESGVSVGFDTRGGKPQVVINIKSAKAEGIEFSSQLLKLARIIEKD